MVHQDGLLSQPGCQAACVLTCFHLAPATGGLNRKIISFCNYKSIYFRGRLYLIFTSPRDSHVLVL